jgi:hypothetical protein
MASVSAVRAMPGALVFTRAAELILDHVWPYHVLRTRLAAARAKHALASRATPGPFLSQSHLMNIQARARPLAVPNIAVAQVREENVCVFRAIPER